MKVIILNSFLVFFMSCYSQKSNAVKIGEQTWMAKNVEIKTEKSVCYAYGDTYCEQYGRLYNWEDAMEVCPAGWKLPSDKDWDILTEFLRGAEIAGAKLKEGGESGFNGLFGGLHNEYGTFQYIKRYGTFWTSTETSKYEAYDRYISRTNTAITKNKNKSKNNKLSVRCIKVNKRTHSPDL